MNRLSFSSQRQYLSSALRRRISTEFTQYRTSQTNIKKPKLSIMATHAACNVAAARSAAVASSHAATTSTFCTNATSSKGKEDTLDGGSPLKCVEGLDPKYAIVANAVRDTLPGYDDGSWAPQVLYRAIAFLYIFQSAKLGEIRAEW